MNQESINKGFKRARKGHLQYISNRLTELSVSTRNPDEVMGEKEFWQEVQDLVKLNAWKPEFGVLPGKEDGATTRERIRSKRSINARNQCAR